MRTTISRWTLGGSRWRIRSLADRSQHADPRGEAARRGITDAAWPFFGLVWPAGVVLADAVGGMALRGRRVLELGCGLALAGLVAQRRGADITVSDRHPLASGFLAANARLNGLAPVRYRHLDWGGADRVEGRFDLIVGSDVLYEAWHAEQLVALVDRHGTDAVDVVVADPGRRGRVVFVREMVARGFVVAERQAGGRLRVLSASRTSP